MAARRSELVLFADWTLCVDRSECCQRFIRASELLFCPPSLLSLDFMLADALIRVLLALHQGVRVSFFGPLLLLAFRNFYTAGVVAVRGERSDA